MGRPNLGSTFVGAFKWLLLVLLGLTIQRSVDALAVKATGATQFFKSPVVLFPIPCGWPLSFHSEYVSGILEALVILILAGRYFVTSIDPITAVCRNNGDIDFGSTVWKQRLAKVKPLKILSVSFASVIEFILLVHAAVSLPSIEQWLNFLALLAFFDLLYFIVRPWLSLWLVRWPVLHIPLASYVASIARREWQSVIGASTEDNSGDNDRKRKLEKDFDEFHDRVKLVAQNYFRWDLLDLAIAVSGIGLTRFGVGEFKVAIFVSLATALVSWTNVRSNWEVYADHVGVLLLVPDENKCRLPQCSV